MRFPDASTAGDASSVIPSPSGSLLPLAES